MFAPRVIAKFCVSGVVSILGVGQMREEKQEREMWTLRHITEDTEPWPITKEDINEWDTASRRAPPQRRIGPNSAPPQGIITRNHHPNINHLYHQSKTVKTMGSPERNRRPSAGGNRIAPPPMKEITHRQTVPSTSGLMSLEAAPALELSPQVPENHHHSGSRGEKPNDPTHAAQTRVGIA